LLANINATTSKNSAVYAEKNIQKTQQQVTSPRNRTPKPPQTNSKPVMMVTYLLDYLFIKKRIKKE
jgi:hypothetical protein